MKNSILILAILFTSFTSFSQLRGSGKTVTKTYDYQDFNKVNFDDLNGKLEIGVGKPFSISITIDDNLVDILSVIENSSDKELTITLKENRNNKKYIENTNIRIKVTLPSITSLRHNGNSSLTVTNCNSDSLLIENLDNASTTISGKTDTLIIKNTGNGNLYADKLVSKTAAIKCSGNGNVSVNVTETITAKTSGNGNIVNKGIAKFDSNSSKSGNGSLINR
jgi:Putative auto-transporter adhesin, head GIN domain